MNRSFLGTHSIKRAVAVGLFVSLLLPSIPASATDGEAAQDPGPVDEVELDELVETPPTIPYVFGGQATTNPGWVASIIADGLYSCTGSLVHPEWVLTAAHCADDPVASYEVFVGGNRWFDGTHRTVASAVIHPGWNASDLTTVDLALLKLSSPVSGLSIPDLAASATWPTIGQTIVVVGWGETYKGSPIPEYLQGATVTVNSDHTGVPSSSIFCNPSFVEASSYEDFCFGTATAWACPGDSGGPLVGRSTPQTQSGPFEKVYGVTSFGGIAGCDSFDEPVGQPVGPHVGWINSVIPQSASPGPGDEMFFYRADGLYRFYDINNSGGLSKPIRAGNNYTRGWSIVVGIDLEGDGTDEMFFYRDDGLYRFYDVRPDGSLGSPLKAGDEFTRGWDAIAGIDVEGDGQDEMFFYRNDGLYRYYDVRTDGSIGSPLSAGNEYTRGWSSITALDLDGDGQDEFFFYRADGLYRYYDIRPDGTIPKPLVAGNTYTRNWTSILGTDLEGDGQDEMFFYRDDGLYRYYNVRPNGSLPSPLAAGDSYAPGWTAISAVDLGD